MSANSFTKMSTKTQCRPNRCRPKLGCRPNWELRNYRDQMWIDQIGFGQIVQHDLVICCWIFSFLFHFKQHNMIVIRLLLHVLHRFSKTLHMSGIYCITIYLRASVRAYTVKQEWLVRGEIDFRVNLVKHLMVDKYNSWHLRPVHFSKIS